MRLERKKEGYQMQTEAQYRQIHLASYSALKILALDKLKFYRTYITKEMEQEDPGPDMIRGSLVDNRNLPESIKDKEFEEKFYQCEVSELKKEDSQGNYFACTLWKLTKAAINEEGVQTISFESLADEAFQLTKFNRKGEEVRFKKKELAYAIEQFSGSMQEQWYREKRNAHGRIVVNGDDITAAESIAETLKSWRDTAGIFNQKTNEEYRVEDQFPIVFQHDGIDLKMLADKIIWDHENKTIQIYDLKCSWNIYGFSYDVLEKGYYLQGVLYYYGVAAWVEQEANEYQDYTILPPIFIVCHSANWAKPVLYQMTSEDIEKSLKGFKTKNGRRYKGLSELIRELEWSMETGIWATTKELYENNSVSEINIPYA